MAASFLFFLGEGNTFGHVHLQKVMMNIKKRPPFAFSVANCGRVYILRKGYLLNNIFVEKTTPNVEKQDFF
jgi:hypothetical protein